MTLNCNAMGYEQWDFESPTKQMHWLHFSGWEPGWSLGGGGIYFFYKHRWKRFSELFGLTNIAVDRS